MSDKMRPVSPVAMVRWIHEEFRRHRSVFGIPQSQIYATTGKADVYRFGRPLDTPIGPAAGPHTQLAQNLLAAYLVGGRFFELKTVQILDHLDLLKPCIDAQDECYNTEWSQELGLKQSEDSYITAWVLSHYLNAVLGLSPSPTPGIIFNLSVGYDLQGIQSDAMDAFIEGMKDASHSAAFEASRDALLESLSIGTPLPAPVCESQSTRNRAELRQLVDTIPSKIANSVTLSTMHGCPPDEIEAIAAYLLREKRLHTLIKLNPTLLGFDRVADLLSHTGFGDIALNPESFSKDLALDQAVPMLRRLNRLADGLGLFFGVKLTNTLGVINTGTRLVGEDMYLSGRALFPLTVHTARELVGAMGKDVNISYCGGANSGNVTALLKTGMFPITVVTDLLKPGGYLRMGDMVEAAQSVPWARYAASDIDVDALRALSRTALSDEAYQKGSRDTDSLKLQSPLPVFDCFVAPCVVACPIHQDIPEYIHLVGQKRYFEALESILTKNPLPHITGAICDHLCMTKCTRWDYDAPLAIRDIKLKAAQRGLADVLRQIPRPQKISPTTGRVAIVGAGPAGLSAAGVLARHGMSVTVFEAREKPGGLVEYVIPGFRLPQSAMADDLRLIERLGVTFRFGASRDLTIDALRNQGFTYVFLAIGASISPALDLEESTGNVISATEFLEAFNAGAPPDLGRVVAVIGGGNSAMDAARAALRCAGTEQVRIVYRRTRAEMPADREEYSAAVKDGVDILELLQPVRFKPGTLTCRRMRLGGVGGDGRHTVVPLPHARVELDADTILAAIGEKVDSAFLQKNGIECDPTGRARVDEATLETNRDNVFIGGDARRGPATVVTAIADGSRVAHTIIDREGLPAAGSDATHVSGTIENETLLAIHGKRREACPDNVETEAGRCLACNVLCNKCVDVCPNRANVPIAVETSSDIWRHRFQILHLDALCNECGNCATFCPHDGRPYADKPTLFIDRDDFDRSRNPGLCVISRTQNQVSLRVRHQRQCFDVAVKFGGREGGILSTETLDPKVADFIEQIVLKYGYLLDLEV